MSDISALKNRKPIYLILLIGIIISIFYANFNLKVFDKNENNNHLMIRGDTNLIWYEAETFKKDLINNKNFFGNGSEYMRTFLPSKLIAFYSLITGYDLYEDFTTDKKSTNGKLLYLLFQILFYYLSLLFLYERLLDFYNDKKISLYITSFLALDLNILQWHGTFWTESIFFSLQIIFIAMLLKENKSIYFSLLLGFLIGVMCLQKTIALMFIFFVMIYLIFSEKNFMLKILSIFFSFFVVLTLLGYDNYKKTGIFYVLPSNYNNAHYSVLIPQIYVKNKLNISELKNLEEKWKQDNNFSEESFQSQYDFRIFKKKKAIEIMLDNKLTTIKIYLKNSIHHAVLNPAQTYFWHKYNQLRYRFIEFHLSLEEKKYFKYRIIYSLIFYLVVLAGLYEAFINNKSLKLMKFHILIIFLIFYSVFMLGWVGNSRYFMPSVIFLSIYFGHGVKYLSKIRTLKI